jgi:hypothetical protein
MVSADAVQDVALANVTGTGLDQARLRAEQAGLPLEAYLAQCVGQILDRPADDFRRAAERILQTNAELYRRLA